MFRHEVLSEVSDLISADPACCARPELDALVTTSARVRSWLDAYDVRLAQRATDLAAAGAGSGAADVLANVGRRCARDAAAAARRAQVCDLLPDVHQALADGRLSAGHVDALAHAAASLDDAGRAELADLQPALIANASAMPVDAFGRDVRRLERLLSPDDGLSEVERNRRNRKVRRWKDRETGVCHTHLELDAETDAKVAAALDAAVAAARSGQQDTGLTFDQLQADALVELITRQHGDTSTSAGRPIPEVIVLIDLDTLRSGLHDRGIAETADGTPLPVASLRRLCCDALIIPVVLNADGAAVDVGREQRVATRHQRRALRAMYTTCGHPGCTVRFDDCQIHHVVPWEQGGPTDLSNLIPLCCTHHHLVHEGGFTLKLHPDRTIELRRPDRSVHHHGPTTTRPPGGLSEIPVHLRRAAERAPAKRAAAQPPPSPPSDAVIQAQRAAVAAEVIANLDRCRTHRQPSSLA